MASAERNAEVTATPGRIGACCAWVQALLERIGFGEVIPASKCAGRAVVALRSVILIASAWTFVIAIVGLKRFMGALQQRCVEIVPSHNHTRGKDVLDEGYFIYSEDIWSFCGNTPGAKQCEAASQVCKHGVATNPNYGYTHFDSLGFSYLSTVRLITYDFWESVYYMLILTKGYWCVPFFLVVILSSYFFLGLLLAVILKTCNPELPAQKKEVDLGTKEQKSDDLQPMSLNGISSREVPTGPVGRCTDWMCVWECCNCWTTFSQKVSQFILNPFVEIGIVILLLCNIIDMCSDHDQKDDAMYHISRHLNTALVLIFILEAVLKILALSPKGYFKKGWNIFEFFLALIGIIELGLEGVQGLAVLRSLRVLRILRLGRYWPTLNVLRISMRKSFSIQFQFIVGLGLLYFFFAWIGTELYGRGYEEGKHRFYQGELPRWSYVDPIHSFLVLFRITCGEWIECMFDCMLVNGLSCIPYTAFVALFGKYLLVNIFLVFLLWGMHSSNSNYDFKDGTIPRLSKAVDQIANCFLGVKNKFCPSGTNMRLREDETVVLSFHEDLEAAASKRRSTDISENLKVSSKPSEVLEYPPDCCPEGHCIMCIPSNGTPSCWKSLRGFCLTSVQSLIFDIIILTVVVIGCIPLVMRQYEFIAENSMLYLDTIEIIVIVLFLVEMTIKFLAYGWSQYFKNGWRTIELLIVIVVFLNMLTLREKGISYKFLQSFQVLRLFRILKYFIRFDSFRKVLNSLLLAFPAIVNTIIVMSVMWLLYTIWGMQLFGGKFYNCVDETGGRINITLTPDKVACLQHNFTWANEDITFDNIFESVTSLIQVATVKGWISIMHHAMDSRAYDEQHDTEVNVYMSLYFVLFIVHVSFYTSTLFLSNLLDAFLRQDRILGGSVNENKGDAVYRRALENIKNKSIDIAQHPNGQFRQFLWKLVPNGKFQCVVVFCILASMATMAGDYDHKSASTASALNGVYIVLLVVLAWEVAIRFLGSSSYLAFFQNTLNALDVVTLILTIVDVSSHESVSSNLLPPMLLRLPRLLQLFFEQSWSKHFLGFRRISLTISRTVPYALSIYLLLGMVTLVYAICGVAIFSYVEARSDEFNFVNFEGLGNALALMYQITTLAGWDGYFSSLAKDREVCSEYFSSSCGSAAIAPLFVLSFLIITYILTFSVLVIVVLNYQSACNDIRLGVAPDDSDGFYKKWLQFDMAGQGYINYRDLSSFLDSLTGSLRMAKPNARLIALMDIPIYSGQHVYHKEVLASLTRQQIINQGLRVSAEEKVIQFNDVGYEAISSTLWRVHEEKCVKTIEEAWNQYKLRKISKR